MRLRGKALKHHHPFRRWLAHLLRRLAEALDHSKHYRTMWDRNYWEEHNS
jgi:hypothetical protein